MKKLKHIVLGLGLCLFQSTGVFSQAPSKPFGSNTSYEFGTMQTYQTAAQASAVSQSWYTYWSTSFVKSCGADKAIIANDYGSNNAYSEGQGYGMLLAAYQGDKATFDKLVKGYFDNTNSHGLMNWTASCNGMVGANGATDGDLDAAMALLVALKQWPTSTSPHNYASLATTLIGNIKTHEFTECSGKIVQKGGDYLGGCNCTNPSYYATGYYRAFAKHVPGDAAWWTKAADDGLDLLLKATHPTTGLNPAWTDASGSITSGGTGDCNNIAAPGGGSRTDYQFDAARTPWRIVVDYLWWGTPKAKQYLDKITAWSSSKGIDQIFAGHTLNGNAYLTYTNSAFVGAFAIGAMGTTNQTTVNTFYQYWVNNSMHDQNYASGKKLDDKPYFQNSLRTMYHFVASGNFWNPYATGGPDNPPASVVTISLTAPANNATVTSGSAVTMTATASSTQGATISKVEFLVDGELVNSDVSSPFSFSTSTLTAGPHTIAARATDSNGKTATSTEVNITVSGGTSTSVVTVSLSGPANNATIAQGSPVAMTATASSTNSATISKVEFLVDGVVVNTDLTAPFTYSATNLTSGTHTLATRATDSNGSTSTTPAVTITITGPVTPSTSQVSVKRPNAAPVIDGTVDNVWTGVSPTDVSKVIIPTVTGASDLSATFRTLWDDQNFYVLVNVTDESRTNDSGNDFYQDDAVELFFDIGNDRAATYGTNDVQYSFRWNDNTVHAGPAGRSTANIQHAMVQTSTGYVLEVRIPWATFQTSAIVNQALGFDVHVNDDDNGAARDGKIAWAAATDDAWQNPSLFGTATLTAVVTGYQEEFASQMVRIFPNPTSGSITVEGLNDIEYNITDLSGKLVQSGTSNGTIETNFESGVYNFVIKKPLGFKPVKIVKMQ